jgi:hypothetical protein
VNAVVEGAAAGSIAAMAMTGMRSFTETVGIVEETPPKAILRQKTKGLIYLVPRKKRRAAMELAHWGYGAVGGAVYGATPEALRKRPWVGPAYGLALWVGFEAALAPVLGLSQAKKLRPMDRAGLAVDHLLYGWVLASLQKEENP